MWPDVVGVYRVYRSMARLGRGIIMFANYLVSICKNMAVIVGIRGITEGGE